MLNQNIEPTMSVWSGQTKYGGIAQSVVSSLPGLQFTCSSVLSSRPGVLGKVCLCAQGREGRVLADSQDLSWAATGAGAGLMSDWPARSAGVRCEQERERERERGVSQVPGG